MTFGNRYTGLINKYRDHLPVSDDTRLISLGEGNTPLIKLQNIPRLLGKNVDIYVKYEGLNPTGSFKDRGMTMAVTKAVEEGSKAIICASTGNTSASLAAYAAQAGMQGLVFIPEGQVALAIYYWSGRGYQDLVQDWVILDSPEALDAAISAHIPPQSLPEQWDLPGLEKVLAEEWSMTLDLQGKVQASSAITDEDLLEMVVAAAHTQFQSKLEQVGAENFVSFERMILLQSIDTHWREHLSALDYLRQGIHLRGYAQKQPKQEYKREAFELFGQLLDAVKNEVTKTLMMVRIDSGDQMQQAAQAIEERAEQISNVTYSAPDETGQPQTVAADLAGLQQAFGPVGRNEPCPCGSGKKFKQCHGKLA